MVLEKDRLAMYLERMHAAISAIYKYTKDIDIDTIEKHPIILDACLMQMIHIWETANKLAKKFPKFEWLPLQEMIQLRNFAAHDYLGINTHIIKKIIKDELRDIDNKISKLL